MNKSLIYIVGATVLGGGAYLFLKNKKEKDLSKLAEIGGATSSGTTPSGTTLGGTTASGTTPSLTTPSITEPVKIDIKLVVKNNMSGSVTILILPNKISAKQLPVCSCSRNKKPNAQASKTVKTAVHIT